MRSSARLVAHRHLLSNRPFVALWLGQAISAIGDSLYNVALLWHVLGTTGSAFAAAGITVAAGIGGLVGSLLAGAVLDRLPGRRILLATDAARLACTALVGLPWLLGLVPPLAGLYGLAALNALATALHNPARAAALPQIVPRDALVTANALEGVAASLTNTAVWALSGAIVAGLGPARALTLDAASFLAALLAVLAVRWPEATTTDQARQSPGAQFRAGFAVVRADPLLRGWFALLPAHAFLGGCFFACLAPFLRRQLAGGAELYGIQGAVYGIGVLLACALIGALAVRRIGPLYIAGITVNALGNIGFGLAPSVAALLVAASVAGLGAGALITGERALLQTVVPAPYRGRVFALGGLSGLVAFPLGVALGGWLGDRWQPQPVLLLASLLHLAIGLRLAALPGLRHATTASDAAPPPP